MNKLEIMAMRMQAVQNRREQLDAVASACIKMQMYPTLNEGLGHCPPPANTHPLRWRAMIINFIVNDGNV